MISRWFRLKDKAILLRKSGKSIREIENKLKIPRSTLSGWFRDIKLSEKKRKILDKNWRKALSLARKKAVVWHNKGKKERLRLAEIEALKVSSKIDANDKNILELTLAMLYFGEGFKTSSTGIGNSDIEILKFFVKSMEMLYNFSRKNVTCHLHLRADQNHTKVKKYWSTNLGIPSLNFKAISVDKRTVGKKTYDNYMGVCILNYGNIAIQRKLLYLSRQFCNKIIKGD